MRRAVRPSHFRSLFRVADSGLSVRDITSTDLWSAPAGSPTLEVFRLMTECEYDVAPLLGGPPDRYVERRWLGGADVPLDGIARSLDASLVVTSTLSLADAMRELQKRDFFFVLEGQTIVGVVTRADVQRPAVSMIVLEFILIIEAGLARLIEAHFGATWRAKLPAQRLEAAEARLAERKRRNASLTLEDCLTFEDRIRLTEDNADLLKRASALRARTSSVNGRSESRDCATRSRMPEQFWTTNPSHPLRCAMQTM